MEIVRVMITRKFLFQLFAWLVISLAMLGVCAQCEDEGGWYQGGGDSIPNDRR